MPNDAKMGMVAGVMMVIAIALVFFHKDANAVNVDSVGNNRANVNGPGLDSAPRLASGTPLPIVRAGY